MSYSGDIRLKGSTIFPIFPHKIHIIKLPSPYIFKNVLYDKNNLNFCNKHNKKHGFNSKIIITIDIPKFRLYETNKCFVINNIRFLTLEVI